MTRLLICFVFFWALSLHPAASPAQNIVPEKPERSEVLSAKAGSSVAAKAPAKPADGIKPGRDPMIIPDMFGRQMEDLEPPEVRITGIIEAGKNSAAIAELNLDNFEGIVLLEPGMIISIPKPNRNESISNRWMTTFTVKNVSRHGVLILLENGEKIRFPIMGEKE